ncbi:hypothetical protein JCM11251_003642 [Rhodosporidiobolus azoricus]
MQIPASQTASSLLIQSTLSHRFSSTCTAIDRLLTPQAHVKRFKQQYDESAPAGLGLGTVVELMGPPGIGKSRTAMGFVLAERFREDGGEVLIVDAEGSLLPALLKDTVTAYGAHHGYDDSSVREVLEGTRYRRIDSAWLLVAFFISLETWLANHPKVTLIVIDSLTAHFRPHLDVSTRNHLADTIRSTLSAVCSTGRVSVILTTSLSLKLFDPLGRPSSWSREAEGLLVPQIAEKWMPESLPGGGGGWRVLLYYSETGERLARLVSSPTSAQATDAAFTMDLLGPCDYPVPPEPGAEEGEEPPDEDYDEEERTPTSAAVEAAVQNTS